MFKPLFLLSAYTYDLLAVKPPFHFSIHRNMGNYPIVDAFHTDRYTFLNLIQENMNDFETFSFLKRIL